MNLTARSWPLALLVAVGCTEGGGSPDPGPDRSALLTNLADNVIVPALSELVSATGALDQATKAYADAVGTATVAPAVELQAAQDAWRRAMVAAQRGDVMQVGPAAELGTRLGAAGIRDEIYSWPGRKACAVDLGIVSGKYADPGHFDAELVNTYGLDALEYLLFHHGANNACQSSISINMDGSWAGLDAAARLRRRADYAAVIATRVAVDARRLGDAWTAGFAQRLAAAGDGDPFPTGQAALDDLFAAIFYLELKTKDLKLGVPSGADMRCAQDTCPERLESPWAAHSKENVLANLEGFRAMFSGGDGEGFDDLLRMVNAGDLADEMDLAISAAISAVTAVDGSFVDALQRDPEAVRAAYRANKILADHLKSRFVTVLNLRVPDEGAADND